MTNRIIEEDFFVKHRIVDPHSAEGRRIHEFLLLRGKALGGRYIDFDKTPVTFVLSDSDQLNAFHMAPPNPDPDKKPPRDDYSTIRYTVNPLKTDVIGVTRGLVDAVDSRDQLDQAIGHELTHMIMRRRGIERNSKGEEEIADLHAVDLMYDAGGDPKQALVLSGKIGDYIEQQRAKKKERKHHYTPLSDREREIEDIHWAEIFDVHMSAENRKTGIEAALTRLSHLIDERTPAEFDKTVFDALYEDPVDAFLRTHNFDAQKPLGRLKVLVDCIDHLATPIPHQVFFQEKLDALPPEPPEEQRYSEDPFLRDRRKLYQEQMETDNPRYFQGPVIPKKYQQKIASLAEGVIRGTQAGYGSQPSINTEDLNIYVQNKAYGHIAEHGYPEKDHLNYLSSAGILYTYFHHLFKDHSRRKERGWGDKPSEPVKLTKLEIDIEKAKDTIRTATSLEGFASAIDQLKTLSKIQEDITTIRYRQFSDKFDNLSSFKPNRDTDYRSQDNVYGELRADEPAPWNNLVTIAGTGEEARTAVLAFLKDKDIEDFRISHGLPYIRKGSYTHYEITADGKIADKKLEGYELDFAVQRETVLEAYAYVSDYFDNEAEMIAQARDAVLSIDDPDFIFPVDIEKEFNNSSRFERDDDKPKSPASKTIYDFISMFNALPAEKPEDEDERIWGRDRTSVMEMIPERYRQEHLIPGSKIAKTIYGEDTVSNGFNDQLLEFTNPIFQEHFGADFRDRLTAQKNMQQEEMFETAFVLLQQAIDMWLDAEPKVAALQKRCDELRYAVWREQDPAFEALRKEDYEAAAQELQFYEEKSKSTADLVHNIFYSIFEGKKHWFHLQRLTPEQKKKIAEFGVLDEKGAVRKILHTHGYEHLCNYLGILEQQIDLVVAGHDQLAPSMQIVAGRYGYKAATNRQELESFVKQQSEAENTDSDNRYGWYLHMFDVMRHLEQTPDMDIHNLSIALRQIEYSTSSGYLNDPENLKHSCYRTYARFVSQSNLVPLVEQAIAHDPNYADLSCDTLLDTASNLLSVRRGLLQAFQADAAARAAADEKNKARHDDDYFESAIDFYDEEDEPEGRKEPQTPGISPEHKAFLSTVHERVNTLIRQAEAQALQKPDALEKIRDIYNIYQKGKSFSENMSGRLSYAKKLDQEEDRLDKIAEMAKDPTFWPEDALDHAKAFVYAKNTFLDDREFEDKIINDILDKAAEMPAGKRKNECFFILLDKNLRSAYPETRERLFTMYVDDVSEKLGPDDKSEPYQKRLAIYLKALNSADKSNRHGSYRDTWHQGLISGSIGIADKYLLLRDLSDRIISQEQTSDMIKDALQIKLGSKEMMDSYLYGIGVDCLTKEMDRDPELAQKFIQFFNSKGGQPECEELSAYIDVKMREKYENSGFDDDKKHLKKILANTRSRDCKILYENFWSAPLKPRSVITSRILKSSVRIHGENEDHGQQAWERVFATVMNNIISPDDESVEAKYAREVMHSYIKSRSDYERVLILSAMMVANRNIGGDTGNIGKALKLFLENMGPAEIKLGQAIASHPNTPQKIKDELQELKGAADSPPRWALFDWIRAENIPTELWKYQYLGDILGSASYYTTTALGDGKVLRILRPEAREKAAKGFRVIRLAVDDLKDKDAASDLKLHDLTSSVQEMVIQAAKMSDIETDHEIGVQQYGHTKEADHGVVLKSGGDIFKLRVMDWRVTGKNWIIMDRAKGPTFKDLPETAPAQLAYKKNFAKAYVLYQLEKRILAGKKFDHDRHWEQLSIDPETNEVGIYDTGAMALEDPTVEEQTRLGHILYDVIKHTIGSGDMVGSFSKSIGQKIEALHRQGSDISHLVEVKKALLALSDFFAYLDQEDIKDIFAHIIASDDLSAPIADAISSRSSWFEQTTLKAFAAIQLKGRKDQIAILRDTTADAAPVHVIRLDVAPDTPIKSNWFDTIFGDKEDQPKTDNGSLDESLLAQDDQGYALA